MDLIREFFAVIYENLIYDPIHQIIFQHLFQGWGYIYFGLIFIFLPMLFSAAFYFLYLWNPYAKWWHWAFWLTICLAFVFGATYGTANLEIFASNNTALNQALASPQLPHYDYAVTLPYIYGAINVVLAFFVYMLFSLIFKQFSKLHSHLPI